MVKKEWIDKGFVDEPVAKELDLKSEIRELCRKKNAVIMAHYYTEGIIQDLADFVGDSLALAQKAAKTEADIIVMCGVHFMGETNKILCPDKIAHDYMKLMGIVNTQFIIARHTDRDHPHCHIVYNRVDNDGCTISDKNDRYRNEKVCKMLTARYRLHFAEGKEHVNFMRLRHHDKVKYFIYHALKREVPNARSWSELRLALRKYGIDTQWKLSRTTGEMQGVKFTCDQLTFSGSKIDRQFSFLNIDQELRYNALSATVSQCQAQAETIREEPRPEYQQENHSGISLGLFTPSPTDYDTEEAIQANWLKKKKKKPKRKRGFSL